MPPSLVEDRLDWLLISSDEQVPAAAAGRMGRKEEAIMARMARSFILRSFGFGHRTGAWLREGKRDGKPLVALPFSKVLVTFRKAFG